MDYRMNLISLAGSIFLLVIILGLVRAKRLSEKYSLLWLLFAVIMIILSIWRGLLVIFAGFCGIYYPPAFIFLAAIFLGVIIAIHFSMAITDIAGRQVKMAQEIAALNKKVKEINEGKKD